MKSESKGLESPHNAGVSAIIKKFNNKENASGSVATNVEVEKAEVIPPPQPQPVKAVVAPVPFPRKKFPLRDVGDFIPYESKIIINNNHLTRLNGSPAITDKGLVTASESNVATAVASASASESADDPPHPPEHKVVKRSNRVLSMIAAFEKSAPEEVTTSCTTQEEEIVVGTLPVVTNTKSNTKAQTTPRWRPKKQEEEPCSMAQPSMLSIAPCQAEEEESIPVSGASYPCRADANRNGIESRLQKFQGVRDKKQMETRGMALSASKTGFQNIGGRGVAGEYKSSSQQLHDLPLVGASKESVTETPHQEDVACSTSKVKSTFPRETTIATTKHTRFTGNGEVVVLQRLRKVQTATEKPPTKCAEPPNHQTSETVHSSASEAPLALKTQLPPAPPTQTETQVPLSSLQQNEPLTQSRRVNISSIDFQARKALFQRGPVPAIEKKKQEDPTLLVSPPPSEESNAVPIAPESPAGERVDSWTPQRRSWIGTAKPSSQPSLENNNDDDRHQTNNNINNTPRNDDYFQYKKKNFQSPKTTNSGNGFLLPKQTSFTTTTSSKTMEPKQETTNSSHLDDDPTISTFPLLEQQNRAVHNNRNGSSARDHQPKASLAPPPPSDTKSFRNEIKSSTSLVSKTVDFESIRTENCTEILVDCQISGPAKQDHAIFVSQKVKSPISSTARAQNEIHIITKKVPAPVTPIDDFGELSYIQDCSYEQEPSSTEESQDAGVQLNSSNCSDDCSRSLFLSEPPSSKKTAVIPHLVRPNHRERSPPANRSPSNALQIKIQQFQKQMNDDSFVVLKVGDPNLMIGSMEPTEESTDESSSNDADIKVSVVEQDLSVDDMRQIDASWKRHVVTPLASLCDRSIDVPNSNGSVPKLPTAVSPERRTVKLLQEQFDNFDVTIYSASPSSPAGTDLSQEGFEVNASGLSMELIQQDSKNLLDTTQHSQSLDSVRPDDESAGEKLSILDVSRNEAEDDSARKHSEEEAWSLPDNLSRSSKHGRQPSRGEYQLEPPGSIGAPSSDSSSARLDESAIFESSESSFPFRRSSVENDRFKDTSLNLAHVTSNQENSLSLLNNVNVVTSPSSSNESGDSSKENKESGASPPNRDDDVDPVARLEFKRSAKCADKPGAELDDDSEFEPPVVRKAPPSSILLLNGLDFLAPAESSQLSTTMFVPSDTTAEKTEKCLPAFKLPPNPRDTSRSVKARARSGPRNDESQGACPLSSGAVERSASKPNESRIKMLATYVSEMYLPLSSPVGDSAILPSSQNVPPVKEAAPVVASRVPSVPVDLDITPEDDSFDCANPSDGACLIQDKSLPTITTDLPKEAAKNTGDFESDHGAIMPLNTAEQSSSFQLEISEEAHVTFDFTEEAKLETSQMGFYHSALVKSSTPSPTVHFAKDVDEVVDAFDVAEKKDDNEGSFQVDCIISVASVSPQPASAFGMGLIAPNPKDTPVKKSKPRSCIAKTHANDHINRVSAGCSHDALVPSTETTAKCFKNRRQQASPPPEQPDAARQRGVTAPRHLSQTNPMWTNMNTKERMTRWRQIRRKQLLEAHDASSFDEYESPSDRDYDGDASASNPTMKPPLPSHGKQQWQLFNPADSSNQLVECLHEPISALRPRVIEKGSSRSGRSRKSPRTVATASNSQLVEI